MRHVLLATAAAGLIAAGGCHEQQQAYRWQYQAGTLYEYNKLMDAYDPSSGNPPPLPPPSDEPGEGNWLKVRVRQDPVVAYDEPQPHRHTVIVDDPPYDLWYPRTYVGTSYLYSPRRHYGGSSLSIGFGFGSPGFYHGPFWEPCGPFGYPWHYWP